MNEPLHTTLVDAVSLLESHRIAYALIGGLAVSLRAQPRVTADVDLVIAADVDRALELAGALEETSFRPFFQDVTDVIEKAYILPLCHRRTNVKVDMAIGMSGFEQLTVARAQRLEVAGATISVATAEDLLIMKVLAGRPQDEQDLQGLVVAHGKRLDWEYCLRLAADLGEAIDQPLVSRIEALRTAD